jgi:hypothetical protein
MTSRPLPSPRRLLGRRRSRLSARRPSSRRLLQGGERSHLNCHRLQERAYRREWANVWSGLYARDHIEAIQATRPAAKPGGFASSACAAIAS